MTEAVFYVFAAFAVVSASLCILQRNPVSRGALAGRPPCSRWRPSTSCSTPQFIAAIQVLVYAGAVMVLFLFVIMLLNLGHASRDMRGPAGVAAAVVIVGPAGDRAVRALALHAAAARRGGGAVRPRSPIPARVFAAGQLAQQEALARGVVGAVAAPLFQIYLVPVRDHLDPAPRRHRRRGRARQAEGRDAARPGPRPLGHPLQPRRGRRAAPAERHRALHVHRADAQRGQSHLRGPGPAATASSG